MTKVDGLGSSGNPGAGFEPGFHGAAALPVDVEGGSVHPPEPAVASLVARHSELAAAKGGPAPARPLSGTSARNFPAVRAQYQQRSAAHDASIASLKLSIVYYEQQGALAAADRRAGKIVEGLEGQPWHWQQQVANARAEIAELNEAFSTETDRYRILAGLSRQPYVGNPDPETVKKIKGAFRDYGEAFDAYNQAVEGLKDSGILVIGLTAAMLARELQGRQMYLDQTAKNAQFVGSLNKGLEEAVTGAARPSTLPSLRSVTSNNEVR